jgi:hypothetical protein
LDPESVDVAADDDDDGPAPLQLSMDALRQVIDPGETYGVRRPTGSLGQGAPADRAVWDFLERARPPSSAAKGRNASSSSSR